MFRLFLTLTVLVLLGGFFPAPLSAQSQPEIFQGISSLEPTVIHGESMAWPASRFLQSLFDQGLSVEVAYLLLVVPFIAFLIAFLRQVVGVSTFGVYTPLMLSLTFLLLGIWFGLATLLVVLLASYLLRSFVNKMNLLYIPRASFMLSAIGLAFFIVIWFGLQYGSPVAITLAIFPMLMMSTIAERFLSAQSEEGFGEALSGVIQTIVVAVISYVVVIWPWLSHKIIGYPELIILPLAGDLLLGKFTGLRLIEYFRFRTLFRENVEEE